MATNDLKPSQETPQQNEGGFGINARRNDQGGFDINKNQSNPTLSTSNKRGAAKAGDTNSQVNNTPNTSGGGLGAAKSAMQGGGMQGIMKDKLKSAALGGLKDTKDPEKSRLENAKDNVKEKAKEAVKDEAKQVAKKVAKQVVKQGAQAAAKALAANPITWLVLLVIVVLVFVFFTVAYFWKHPAEALKLGLTSIARTVGLGVNSTIENGGASQLAYEVPVSGAGVAQAAIGDYNPASIPAPGTYAYQMSRIDWEKAKYQTVSNFSNCDVITKKVVDPSGNTRSVIDKVVLKANPDKALEGIARANCINKTYPIFNAMLRSQFIRDGINAQIGIRYAYALPEDSPSLNGKTKNQMETMLRNKSLDRIWKQSGGKVDDYSDKAPEKPNDNCGREPDAISETKTKNDDLCAGRVELFSYGESSSYTQSVRTCANSYNFQNAPDLDVAIDKAKLDLTCGIPPDKLVYYYNMPNESLAKSGDDSVESIQAKVHVLRTICKINEYSLKDDDTAEKNYRAQVEDRISSEINAAMQALTYADTTQTRFLSIQELSGDAYKVLGMGNSQEYHHSVNGEKVGIPTDSDALSRIFGIANLKAYKPGETIYNDASTQSALKVLTHINTVTGEEPQTGATKPLCEILNSKNFNDIYYPEKGEQKTAEKLRPQVSDFYDNFYPDFKQALATLDAYSKDSKGKTMSNTAAVASIRINDILKRYVRINANVSTAGTEEGTQNFSRMSTGMQAYKNSFTLAMGGKFSNPNEAVISEAEDRSLIAYQDKINGIGWRLFDSKNPSSLTSRLAVALIDKPQKIASNVASVLGSLFNPAKNLVGSKSSLAYSLTGDSRVAQATSSYEINSLRIDPAAIPEGFYKLDSFKNAEAIEAIIKSNPGVAGTFLGWEKCFREFIPSQYHLLHPDESKAALYKDFCRELFDVNAPTKLANPGILQTIINNPNSVSLSNPGVRSDISFMYRAFHYYNVEQQALTYLSNPSVEDITLNDSFGEDPLTGDVATLSQTAGTPITAIPGTTGPNGTVRVDIPRSCTSGAQAGTTAFAQYVIARFQTRNLGTFNCRSVRGGSSLSLHGEGRAFDAGLNVSNAAEKARGDQLFLWTIQNAANIGAQEIIWNRQIWTPRKGLHVYSGENPHVDHVHIGLNWDGARQLSPFFTTGAGK